MDHGYGAYGTLKIQHKVTMWQKVRKTKSKYWWLTFFTYVYYILSTPLREDRKDEGNKNGHYLWDIIKADHNWDDTFT